MSYEAQSPKYHWLSQPDVQGMSPKCIILFWLGCNWYRFPGVRDCPPVQLPQVPAMTVVSMLVSSVGFQTIWLRELATTPVDTVVCRVGLWHSWLGGPPATAVSMLKGGAGLQFDWLWDLAATIAGTLVCKLASRSIVNSPNTFLF